MAEKASKNILIFTKCRFEYSNNHAGIIGSGQAKVEINKEEIIIFEDLKQPYIFKLTDISKITPSNYTIIIKLSSAAEIRLSELGYNFEAFLEILIKARNMLMSKYLLMNEELIRKDIKAHCSFSYPDYPETINDDCEVIIYKTGLVIQPKHNELLRIPYCEVKDISEIDYGILITSEDNIKILLNQFGYELDSFKKCLFSAIEKLNLFAQEFVRSLSTETDDLAIRMVAGMLMDGKAAMKQNIEKFSVKIWRGLEKLIEKSFLKEEYKYLKSLAVIDSIAIGLKQGLAGELAGDYLWFLVPVFSINEENYENCMILEALPFKKEGHEKTVSKNIIESVNNADVLSKDCENTAIINDLMQDILSDKNEQPKKSGDEDAVSSPVGMATYLFKIFDENEIKSLKNDTEKAQKASLKISEMVRKINKALLAINFRREPIYISDDALNDIKNIRYRFAVENIAALKELRNRFIGRVSHSGFQKWKTSIEKMIKSAKN